MKISLTYGTEILSDTRFIRHLLSKSSGNLINDINISKFSGFLKQTNTPLLNEDGITSKLEIFLQRQAKKEDEIFMFQFQTPLSNTRRTTDISVLQTSLYSSTEPFSL